MLPSSVSTGATCTYHIRKVGGVPLPWVLGYSPYKEGGRSSVARKQAYKHMNIVPVIAKS